MSTVKCHCCGESIEWPPLDYAADPPWCEFVDSDDEFDRRVQLGRDICIIDDKTHFLRGNVLIPIVDSCQTFAWGVWCSLSAKSFHRIAEIWKDPSRAKEPPFFGWLMSELPGYAEPTRPVKASIQLQDPLVAPVVRVTPDHPLGQEQISGITRERIEEFARLVLGDAPPRCPSHARE